MRLPADQKNHTFDDYKGAGRQTRVKGQSSSLPWAVFVSFPSCYTCMSYFGCLVVRETYLAAL